MANFFARLFGKTEKNNDERNTENMIREALEGVIETGGFDLDYDLQTTEEGFSVNLRGSDAGAVTDKEGLLLDAFQIFLKRMLQNRLPEHKIDLQVDCDGFLESSSKELRDLADKLKTFVLQKGGSSYVRALPPRERKVVHRHLADDQRVKSQSIGDGFCKKIRISLSTEAAPRRERSPESEL
jgi:spoIIIJ-associated protein